MRSRSLTRPFPTHRARRRVARPLAWLLLAVCCAVPAASVVADDVLPAKPPLSAPPADQPRPELTLPEIYKATLRSTAWVRNPGVGEGTGWLVDAQQRLVITNHHVVERANGDLEVYFPVYRNGELVTDMVYYRKRVAALAARVVDSDPTLDLALLQLSDPLPESVQAMPLATLGVGPGDAVFSVGAATQGSQALWVFTKGIVRQVYRRRATLAKQQVVFAKVVETQADINRGNSGGPVVNLRGELVAVVSFGPASSDVQGVEDFIHLDEVREYLRQAVPLVDPQTAEDFVRRGDRALRQRQLGRAIGDYSTALRMQPGMVRALSQRGFAYLRDNELEIALGDFNDALRRDPDHAEAYHGRGLVHRQMRNFDAALTDLSEAIRREAASAALYSLYNDRGITYFRAEQYRKALRDFEQALTEADAMRTRIESLEDLVAEFELDRDYAQILANKADALRALGRAQDAIAELDKAVQRDPDNDYIFFIAGEVLFGAQKYEDAVKMYDAAIRLYDREAHYFFRRGLAKARLEKHSEALEDFVAAIDRDNGPAEYFNEAGVCLFRLEDYERAATAFSLAIERNAQNPTYYANRGDARLQREQYREALADLNEAIRLQGDYAWYYALRGQIHRRLADPAAAKADFAKAAQLEPQTYRHEFRRYLVLRNDTKQTLTVYLLYRTKTTQGRFEWFPHAPGNGNQPLVYTLEPGEVTRLRDGDFVINAHSVRVYVRGKEGVIDRYWNQDLLLAPEEGYLTAGELEEFTYTFQ